MCHRLLLFVPYCNSQCCGSYCYFFGSNLIVILPLYRYEKLQRWDDALKAYTAKSSQASNLDATLGL